MRLTRAITATIESGADQLSARVRQTAGVPVALSPTSIERALALLGEHDLEGPRDVEAALELIAGREEDEAPVEISRYDLQLFLWYQLPRQLLAPFEVKRVVAERLGRFLELAGDPAAAYAEICTSEQTLGILRAWEVEEPLAGEQLRKALEASGLEPPDTEALRWRSVMGFEEARLRNRVAHELECWIEADGLTPGERGFKRRQATFVVDFLHRPQAELGGRIALDVIVDERLEHWVSQGSKERREIVDPVVPMLRAFGEHEDRAGEAPERMASLVWLLQLGVTGIELTQTGALNRALVRASVERFPDWWHTERWGPPHREDQVSPLWEVHHLARRMRLLRKTGRRLALTKRGESLLGDPVGLRDAVAPYLIAAEGFACAVQELAVAVLLAAEGSVDGEEMKARLHSAIVADGWNAAGESPDVHQVTARVWGAIRLAEALELLVYEHEYDRVTQSSRSELTLTPPGRELLRLALRSQALG